MEYIKTFEKIFEQLDAKPTILLTELSETITFLMNHIDDNFDLHDMLIIINEIKKMSVESIDEYFKSTLTNYPRTIEDKFIIEIIDKIKL